VNPDEQTAGGWWHEAFPLAPYAGKPPGAKQMLVIFSYDITDHKRLARVAKICEDFGLRVQYSVFECHLEQEQFERFWGRVLLEIDPEEDRLVAYQLDAKNAKNIRTAGTMVCHEKVVCYIV
jgi:CRISPR-associated protein Cas2